MTQKRDWLVVAAMAAVSLAARALFAATTDIFQDEAVYWWVSGRPFGFHPHPPGVGLIIRAGMAVFGHGVFGLRAGSLLLGTLIIPMAYATGRAMVGRGAGLWAAAFLAAVPGFAAGGTVATMDAALVVLWLGILLALWHGTHGGGRGWWIAAALALTLGLYTKYMMVLALPATLAALAATPKGRGWLRRPAPWVATALALLLFVPVFLWWDAAHGWTTLGYHLGARHHGEFEAETVVEYVAAHAGLYSPVFYFGVLGALVWCWRRWRRGDEAAAWLLAFALVPIVFFLPPSILTKREMMRAHWDAIGYAAGAIALGAFVSARLDGRRRTGRVVFGGIALGVAALLTSVLMLGGVMPAPVKLARAKLLTNRMAGWREMAAKVRAYERAHPEEKTYIVGKSFVPALCTAFHLNRREGVYTLTHSRNERYGFTPLLDGWGISEGRMIAERRGQTAIYLHEQRTNKHGEAYPLTRAHEVFARVEHLDDVEVTVAGERLHEFGIYLCRDIRPEAPPASP